MKKFLIVSLMARIGIFANLQSYSQNPAKEERREVRAVENAQQAQEIGDLVKSESFTFNANQIISTINPNINDIDLPGMYGLWVSPTMFKAFLPIYGASSYTGQPTLYKRLDFYTSHFTYNVKANNSGGWTVTIVATDTWTTNPYTFVINVTPEGTGCTLSISSPFQPGVTFNGIIQPINS